MIVGRTYLERGRPVVVRIQWAHDDWPRGVDAVGRAIPAAPRNVLVRRESGELVVRPFRGLRKRSAAGG